MDKKLAVGCTSALSCAGGGGYLLYSQLSSSEVAVEPEKAPAPTTKPAVANAQPEVLPPPKKPDIPPAKPVNPVPAPKEPKVFQPRPGAMSEQKKKSFQDETVGSLFGEYLLDTDGDQSKLEAKIKKIEKDNPKSRNFSAVKTGHDKKSYLKSQCSESYTYKKEQWSKPKPDWTDEEPKKYWDDVWTYCSAKDDDIKPEGWPLAK